MTSLPSRFCSRTVTSLALAGSLSIVAAATAPPETGPSAGIRVVAEAPAALTAERILADSRVADIAITMEPADWRTLRNQSRDVGRAFFGGGGDQKPFSWFRADVTIDGVAIGSVGVRKKGFLGSLDTAAPSLLVDFNRFVDQDPVAGLGRLTLNNNKQDRSLVAQSLTYLAFRTAGVAAPRVGFADVTVNGERLGIYSNVEPIRKPFLARAFGDADGTLWEGTVGDIVPASIDRLDVEMTGSGEDAERLAELGSLLASDDDLDMARIERLVDVEQFLRFWAVESMLGFWDGYCGNQNNYFVYASPVDGLLRFIPWGADGTFSRGFGGPFGGQRGPSAVLAQAALPNRLYFTPGVAARYRDSLRTTLSAVWCEQALLDEVDRLETLLVPRLGARQQDAPEAMERVRAFVRTRGYQIEDALAQWPPEAPSTWRRPTTVRPVGSVMGTIAATFGEAVDGGTPTGDAAVEVVIADEAVALRDVRTSASPFVGRGPAFGPGGPRHPGGGDAPIVIVITATREDDGTPLSFNLVVDGRRIATEDEVAVNGSVTEGQPGFGFPGMMPMRRIEGTFQPEERGVVPGDRLSGRLDLRVMQVEGGPMSQAPPRRPDAPPSPSGEPPRPRTEPPR